MDDFSDCLIVVPCLNEAATLPDLLRFLMADAPGALIVVADGGSTDGSTAVVARHADANVRLLHNPQRIQSAGINLAVDRFGGDRTWLVRVDAHAAYPSGFVAGLVRTAREQGVESVTVPMHATGHGRFQAAAAAAQNSRLGNGGSPHRRAGNGRLVDHGHHALIALAAFRAVGGYDPTQSHNEDAELDLRLAAAGARIWLEPSLTIDYFPRQTLPALFRQYRAHGAGRAATLVRHRTLPRARQALPLAIGPAVALAVPALAWAGLCLGWGAVLAARSRRASDLAAGPAAMGMHLGWSVGFWQRVLMGAAAPRPPLPAPPHTPAADAPPAEATAPKVAARPAPPQIGVVIAVYQAQAVIGDAIRSALAQPEVGEVIVVDDASRDGTAAAAAAADDNTDRLRIVRLDSNGGPAAARNRGLDRATSPLIAILDSDDRFLPGRFAAMAQGSDWDATADNILFVSADAPPPSPADDPVPVAAGETFHLDLPSFVTANIGRRDAPRAELGFLKPLIRRSFLDTHGLRYTEDLRLGEDFDLYARMLACGARFAVSPRCGYVAAERPDSLSGRHSAHDLAALAAADTALLAAYDLPAEARRAIVAHRAHILDKHRHRLFLDVKRERGLVAAIRCEAAGPATFAAVAGDKLSHWWRAAGGRAAAGRPIRPLLPLS